jgi:hypothetical protein
MGTLYENVEDFAAAGNPRKKKPLRIRSKLSEPGFTSCRGSDSDPKKKNPAFTASA